RLREPTPQPPSPSPIYSLRRRKPRPIRHRRSLCCRRGPGGAAATFITDLQVAVGTPRQRFATAAVEFREGHDPREIFVGVAAAADVACRRWAKPLVLWRRTSPPARVCGRQSLLSASRSLPRPPIDNGSMLMPWGMVSRVECVLPWLNEAAVGRAHCLTTIDVGLSCRLAFKYHG
uniref:Uncharacterized protein n=3 Tax=Aegilops tauschii subsp. strangulata TaxID=200361 RepID=A0A453JNL4_AEGTS